MEDDDDDVFASDDAMTHAKEEVNSPSKVRQEFRKQ